MRTARNGRRWACLSVARGELVFAVSHTVEKRFLPFFGGDLIVK
ncbi:hypothetical protein THTE_2574 [Thermogutta terrifontis]|uniref:Uncharacterized protein n=1 Tax=Thermogutta terrifontis TaxID=1331910 RepID=A0A286RGV8_9BACT|nr:hypothetical protein THTE_2574 [Thermogutta terrifontis]